MNELLNMLDLIGISIKARNENLEISDPKKKITPAIIELIRSNKAELLELLKGFDSKKILDRILPREEKEFYQLSAAQSRLYFLYELNKYSTAYNIPQYYKIYGELDINKLEKVIRKIIIRHESLRTSFINYNGEPKQQVHKNVEFKIKYFKTTEGQDINILIKKMEEPFNLNKAPLLRIGLIEIAYGNYVLVVDMHHIITDGVSAGIIMKDFIRLYNEENIPEVNIQYKDYTEWQRSSIRKKQIDKQKEWWLKVFKKEIGTLNLPSDFNRPRIMTYEGDTVGFTITKDVSNKLKNIANEEKTTLYMVLISIFNILLSKLSNSEDIVIGTPVAGRNNVDLEQTFGMFVNTIPLRNFPLSELSYSSFLDQVKSNILQAFDNQDFQFEDLINELKIKRDTSRHPLIDVLFSMNNINRQKLEIADLLIEPINIDYKVAKFDLNLNCYNSDEGLKFSLNYYSKIFEKETVERFISYFKNIIQTVIADRNIKLYEIEILSREEKQKLIYEFNNTTVNYPKLKSVPQVFEEQVEKRPDRVALVLGNQVITYKELNKRSNHLAQYLKNNGIKSNSVVSLFFAPSFDMLIGILGVLKSGAAYLPINPEQPVDRVSYMLNDSCSTLLLTHNMVNVDKLTGVNLIDIDEILCETCCKELNDDYKSDFDSAYLIYTSGTTGKPKGVLLSHQNLVNYFSWFNQKSKLNKNDRTLLVTSYAFDLGYTGLYSSILYGGQLHLVSKSVYLSPDTVLNYIIRNKISYLKLTSSLYALLVYENKFKEALRNIRLLILGGEEINIEAVEKSISLCSDLIVLNHYGPTESTIGCITFEINKNNINYYKNRPVIGRPINNTSSYTLNKNSQIQPFYVLGELCVSGDGLASGYLNNPELTSDKFIAHPYKPGEVLYRTGDLSCCLPDGNIEFLGRIDNQIKIRGFRVELEEIEDILLKHTNIKKSVVVTRGENENKYLCAYVVCKEKFGQNDLQNYLANILPDYMIPSYFIEMDELPLTSNGKINRKDLPTPKANFGKEYIGPSTDIERKLVKIWSEILRIQEEEISIDSNFFEMGGNSLSILTVMNKIRSECNIDISVGELVGLPTIQLISRFLNKPKENTSQIKEKAQQSVNVKRETLEILTKLNR